MMQLSLVPHGVIHTALPQVIPYLKVSEEWTRGRSNIDDILNFILSGRMQLWVVLEDQQIHGHLITEVKDYPRCKMFVVQYCAMEPHVLASVEDQMQEFAEAYARKTGCAGIEFVGRPGWTKSMKKYGYDVQSVMFQKFFEERT
jgi:hypothetical protein